MPVIKKQPLRIYEESMVICIKLLHQSIEFHLQIESIYGLIDEFKCFLLCRNDCNLLNI